MKKRSRSVSIASACCGLLLTFSVQGSAANAINESSLEFGRFGTLALYAPVDEPEQVVLFISGDGGWNPGVVDMARELAGLNVLVVGVDSQHYLNSLEGDHEKCAYPAGDFEALGQFVQKKLGYRQFHRPVLVGYSSGATLVYATLVQASVSTFTGAISLGFCPDLPLRKAMCKGAGLRYKTDAKLGQKFEPVTHVADPWTVLQGEQDQVCPPAAATDFVGEVGGGSIVTLPNVGHGFSVARNWLPQFTAAFTQMVQPVPKVAIPASTSPREEKSISDLPLVEVDASHSGDTLGILLTGDGGWAGLDKELSATLATHGIAVIGWDSLRYYWTPRTPEAAAKDLERILAHYQMALKRDKVILIGYSFGAEVLPFLVRRLPAEMKGHIEKIALLGPGTRAHFEFKLADWIGGTDKGLDIRNEINQLVEISLLCVYGAEESGSLCPELKSEASRSVKLPGGHHFNGDYAVLARLILEPRTTISEEQHQ